MKIITHERYIPALYYLRHTYLFAYVTAYVERKIGQKIKLQ